MKHRFSRCLKLLVILLLVLALAGCDESLRIMKIELGDFPDNIVYFVGEDKTLDLTRGTLLTTIKSGKVYEDPITALQYWTVTDNIDYAAPGVYEVQITWMDTLVCRIPIQVIDLSYTKMQEQLDRPR